MVGDQRYFIFLTILPVLFGAISLLVPGDAGLGPANPYGNSPDEAVEILAVLTIGAVVMGTALAVRDLFGERHIFRREQANGLSATAFLAGKIIVYSLVAIVATTVMTIAAVVGKGAPTHGSVLLGHSVYGATFELLVALAVTTIVSAMVALALSSLATYSEQILLDGRAGRVDLGGVRRRDVPYRRPVRPRADLLVCAVPMGFCRRRLPPSTCTPSTCWRPPMIRGNTQLAGGCSTWEC